MIPLLGPGAPFPPVGRALREPNGLLAASADIDVERLELAYRQGIFPWYGDDEPVLWWSPDPRMVLAPAEFRVARSLRKAIARGLADPALQLRCDTAFADVMRACAAPRPGQAGTWITAPLLAAYVDLHRRGRAHSIEVWHGERLVAGLYGVALGRMFYGESMFTHVTDASKIALATLVRILLAEEIALIDCQQNTRHLASLGGREIDRRVFTSHVAWAVRQPPIDWSRYAGIALNDLLASD